MQRIMKISSLLLCLCLVFGLAACGDGVEQKEESQKLKIVCTLFPQYDFTRQLVGDKAEVTLLLTPGTDSHSYDPSPVDMVKINGSDLFIYTGPLMEGWAAEVVGTLDESVAVLSLAEGKRLKENTDVYSSHVEEDHDHSADPHIWTSPVNAMLIVQEICDKICEID
ncbi:MAG: zinc ABC transporter substrate-binding protein, partial [Clostridia bacterium]|nr:zinc ABC transporter substrate-binding protein [Clostridia bacterium]